MARNRNKAVSARVWVANPTTAGAREAGATAKAELAKAEAAHQKAREAAHLERSEAEQCGNGARDECDAARLEIKAEKLAKEVEEWKKVLKRAFEADPKSVFLSKEQFNALGLRKKEKEKDVASSSPKPVVDKEEKQAQINIAQCLEEFMTKVNTHVDTSCGLAMETDTDKLEQAEKDIMVLAEKCKQYHQTFVTMCPTAEECATEFINKAMMMFSAHSMTIKGLMTVPACWEEYLNDNDLAEVDGEAPKERMINEMLMGVKVDYPFVDSKVDISLAASHPQCNASRLASNMHLVVGASKRAAKVKLQSGEISAVVDVGSGAFGAERLAMARRIPQFRGVYYHAMMTITDPEDAERLRKARQENQDLARWHHVTPNNPPRPNCLNYCHHKAAECTCLRQYNHVQLISNHVLYCLKIADYDNLFKSADSIRGAVHIPVFDGDHGSTLPVQEPEYQWHDARSWGGLWRRTKAKLKQTLTGERQTVLASVRTGTTVYEQQDIGPMISRGGFHVGPLTRTANAIAEPWEFVKTASASAMTAAAGAFLTCPGAVPVKAAQACVAAASAVALTAVATRAGHALARSEQPPPMTEYTVRAHITQTFTVKETREPISHVVKLRRENPQQLVPVTTHNSTYDRKQVQRAQAGILAGGANAKSEAQIHANMARDGVPAWTARDSMDQAKRLVAFLCNPRREPTRPPDWSSWLTAGVCLPFAWGLSKWASLTLRAGLAPYASMVTVPAWGMHYTSTAWALLPLVLLGPTLWGLVLSVGACVALAASA